MLEILKNLMTTVWKDRTVATEKPKVSKEKLLARKDAKRWSDILYNVTVYDGTERGQRRIDR